MFLAPPHSTGSDFQSIQYISAGPGTSQGRTHPLWRFPLRRVPPVERFLNTEGEVPKAPRFLVMRAAAPPTHLYYEPGRRLVPIAGPDRTAARLPLLSERQVYQPVPLGPTMNRGELTTDNLLLRDTVQSNA